MPVHNVKVMIISLLIARIVLILVQHHKCGSMMTSVMDTLSTLLAICEGNPPVIAVDSHTNGHNCSWSCLLCFVFLLYQQFSLGTCNYVTHNIQGYRVFQQGQTHLSIVWEKHIQWWFETYILKLEQNTVLMTSPNGNIFRVTGPLCGEFTGLRWIPRAKASDAKLWCFLWSTHY